jgi:hypothetical protein
MSKSGMPSYQFWMEQARRWDGHERTHSGELTERAKLIRKMQKADCSSLEKRVITTHIREFDNLSDPEFEYTELEEVIDHFYK